MPFPLTNPDHIAAMRKASAERAHKIKPWHFRGPWTKAQRAQSPFNATKHGADSLAVDFAVMYTSALTAMCKRMILTQTLPQR